MCWPVGMPATSQGRIRLGFPRGPICRSSSLSGISRCHRRFLGLDLLEETRELSGPVASGDAHRRDLLSLLLDRDLQDPASFGQTSVLKRRWVIATWRSHLTSPSPRPPATRRRGSAAQLVRAAAAACRTSRGSRARRQLCPGRCTPGGKRRSDRLGSTSWARSGR
jgi:hypothetical protein